MTTTPKSKLRAELIRRNYTAADVLHLLLQGAPAGAVDVLLAVYHEMTGQHDASPSKTGGHQRMAARADWDRLAALYPMLSIPFTPSEAAGWRVIDRSIKKLRRAAQSESVTTTLSV